MFYITYDPDRTPEQGQYLVHIHQLLNEENLKNDLYYFCNADDVQAIRDETIKHFPFKKKFDQDSVQEMSHDISHLNNRLKTLRLRQHRVKVFKNNLGRKIVEVFHDKKYVHYRTNKDYKRYSVQQEKAAFLIEKLDVLITWNENQLLIEMAKLGASLQFKTQEARMKISGSQIIQDYILNKEK